MFQGDAGCLRATQVVARVAGGRKLSQGDAGFCWGYSLLQGAQCLSRGQCFAGS